MRSIIIAATLAAGALSLCSCGKSGRTAAAAEPAAEDTVSTVYFIKDITPESLVKIYDALGVTDSASNVAVKISTGESMKSHQLDPSLIAPLVRKVNGTLVECNTAYAGNRRHTADHLKAAAEHGYTAIAKVDIMDADGDTAIAIEGGKHLPYDIVGKHLMDYDRMLVLSHFKGHQMGGFGGALKNISIGVASSDGKTWIHSGGKTRNTDEVWSNIAEQDVFLESMADAAKGVIDHMKGNMLYINVANNLSIDCDCNGNPAAPDMKDIGILASTDPVALDRACVDLIYNSTDPGKDGLIHRMEEMHGPHILDAAEALGIGRQAYKIVAIE